MSRQWVSQPPHEMYGYPNHPQQQSPQKYSSVQYLPHQGPPQTPYQQHNYAQAGPYHQPYQQSYQQQYQHRPAQPYKPPLAQPTPSTCYNCGSPDHWAQNCPEPRREAPAGDLNRTIAQRPFKKYRPNYIPPVITKYTVPPNVQSGSGSAPGYGMAPYDQPGIPRYQVPYGQPTPVSAQSLGYQQYHQWQEAQLQQQAHQVTQYPNKAYSQQPVVGHGSPAPLSYGPQYSSPVSAQGPPPKSRHHPPYGQASYPQNAEHAMAYSSSRYSVAEIPFSANRSYQESNTELARQRSLSQSQSMKSLTMTPGPQSGEEQEDDSDEDDLRLLDIPDTPVDAGYYGGRNAKLVLYPLPASVEELEAFEVSLLSPVPHSGGCIKSAFIVGENLESFLEMHLHRHGQGSTDEDPIFVDTSNGDECVPLAMLRETRGRRTCNELKYSLSDKCDGDIYDPNSRPVSTHSGEFGHDRRASLSLTNGSKNDGWDRSSEQHFQAATTSRPSASAQETEDRLAALGVTGAPKPVRTPARPCPPPEPVPSVDAFHTNGRRYSDVSVANTHSRSRSSSEHAISNYRQYQYSVTPPYDDRHTPGLDARYNSVHGRASTPEFDQKDTKVSSHRERDPFDPNDDDPDDLLYLDQAAVDVGYDQFNRPPPPQLPPTVKRRLSNNNQDRDDQISPGSNSKRHTSYSIYSPGRTNSYHQHESLVKLTGERSYDRKRDRELREDSDDDESKERRRQYDDVTPKLKRRQPKVAEAYSRRW